jgi:hypothetical protein
MQLGGIIGSVVYSMIVKSIKIPGVWLISGIVFGISSMLYVSMKTENIKTTI